MKHYFLGIVFGAMMQQAFSQTEKSTALLFNTGNILIHTKKVENVTGVQPSGFEFKYRFKKKDSTAFAKFSGFPMQGLTIGYTNFNNNILGKSYSANYFLAPSLYITKWLQTEFCINAGITYLTNPHNLTNNATNQSYSTHISAYLGLGIHAQVSINKQLQLIGGFSFRHSSNGGLKIPNNGINWLTNDVGIIYNTTATKPIKLLKTQFKNSTYKKQHFTELSAYISTSSLYYVKNTPYIVFGMQVNRNWQVSKNHAINLGAEVLIDKAMQQKLKYQFGIANSGLRSGILVGHLFIIGNVHFGQQIGRHIHNPNNYFPNWYHRWILTHKLSKSLAVGVSLMAHGSVANFLDFRFVYKW